MNYTSFSRCFPPLSRVNSDPPPPIVGSTCPCSGGQGRMTTCCVSQHRVTAGLSHWQISTTSVWVTAANQCPFVACAGLFSHPINEEAVDRGHPWKRNRRTLKSWINWTSHFTVPRWTDVTRWSISDLCCTRSKQSHVRIACTTKFGTERLIMCRRMLITIRHLFRGSLFSSSWLTQDSKTSRWQSTLIFDFIFPLEDFSIVFTPTITHLIT